MYECTADDIEMLSLSKADRVTYERLSKASRDIADLNRRLETMDARFADFIEKMGALNKRRKEDAAILEEFASTGKTPDALRNRIGIERHRYLNGLDDAD
jgi:predicted translin family RNA/ssDNA-binding protein